MRLSLLAALVFASVLTASQGETTPACLSKVERSRLQSVLTSSRPYRDLESAYYAIHALSVLGGQLETGSAVCDTINKFFDSNKVDSIYYATFLVKIAKDQLKHECKVEWGKSSEVLTNLFEDEEATSQSLFYAIFSLTQLKVKFSHEVASAALTAAFERDDSPLSAGFMFYGASYLNGDLESFHSRIEDMIPQADESDDDKLHFGGSLYTTAVLLKGAYALGEKMNKAPTISSNELKKFANYLMSRKNVFDLQNIAALVTTVQTLTKNPFHIPIAVYMADLSPVSESNPNIKIRIGNLMCESLGKVGVVADTARHLADDAVVLNKKPFGGVKGDDTLFEYNFMSISPARGFYRLIISITPDSKEGRLIGTTGAEVEAKVITKVNIRSAEIAAMDREQSTPSKMQRVDWPKSLTTGLHADDHQKVVMRFNIEDQRKKEPMVVHQCFIKLTHKESKQEIVFVAEADDSMQYKFELDVGAKAKEFGYVSGKYDIEMIIGDAVIENPLSWQLADVELVFPPAPEKSSKTPTVNFVKKSEIHHIFRKPDPRPPATVSTIFTGLILLPALLLLIIWMKLGINVSNFSFSLSTIGFHAGLGTIFFLYFSYWLKLDMFQTINYLAIIGIITFLCCNRMLKHMAEKRK